MPDRSLLFEHLKLVINQRVNLLGLTEKVNDNPDAGEIGDVAQRVWVFWSIGVPVGRLFRLFAKAFHALATSFDHLHLGPFLVQNRAKHRAYGLCAFYELVTHLSIGVDSLLPMRCRAKYLT